MAMHLVPTSRRVHIYFGRTRRLGRHFMSLTTPVQRISANRTLQYSAKDIYEIIADVPSYSSFLPGCISSVVTKWSKPDSTYGRKWPEQAVIEVGWGNVRENFRSNIYCIPERIVESTGGSTQTKLPKAEIAHHDLALGSRGTSEDTILTQLLSRWTLQELMSSRTKVSLDLEFQFANPLYAAMSAAISPKVADAMIEAFEERIKIVLAPKVKS